MIHLMKFSARKNSSLSIKKDARETQKIKFCRRSALKLNKYYFILKLLVLIKNSMRNYYALKLKIISIKIYK